MIYVGENKSVICKGDFHPSELYKGETRIAGFAKTEFSGECGISLENCYNDKLHNAQIIGNSVQDGTPSPETPVEIQSVGELVTEGDYSGKYRIGITARDENGKEQRFDIYLNEPLRKVKGYKNIYTDYIDFETSKIVRKIRAITKFSNNVFIQYGDWVVTSAKLPAQGMGEGYVTATGDSGAVKCSCSKTVEFSNSSGVQLRFSLSASGINHTSENALNEWTRLYDSWVKNGTFQLQYVLKTSVEEEIELPNLPTFKGTTTYEIDTSVSATIEGMYKKVEE